MDDIIVLGKSTSAAYQVLERLAKAKGRPKEIRCSIAGDTIPTVREQPVKSLDILYKNTLYDRHQGVGDPEADKKVSRQLTRQN